MCQKKNGAPSNAHVGGLPSISWDRTGTDQGNLVVKQYNKTLVYERGEPI